MEKRGITLIKNKLWPNLHFYAHLKPSYLSAEIAQYEASWPVTRETRYRYPVNSFSYLSKSIICHFFVLYYHIIDDYYVSLNNPLNSNRFLFIFFKTYRFSSTSPLHCVIIVITSQRVFLKFNRRLYYLKNIFYVYLIHSFTNESCDRKVAWKWTQCLVFYRFSILLTLVYVSHLRQKKFASNKLLVISWFRNANFWEKMSFSGRLKGAKFPPPPPPGGGGRQWPVSSPKKR